MNIRWKCCEKCDNKTDWLVRSSDFYVRLAPTCDHTSSSNWIPMTPYTNFHKKPLCTQETSKASSVPHFAWIIQSFAFKFRNYLHDSPMNLCWNWPMPDDPFVGETSTIIHIEIEFLIRFGCARGRLSVRVGSKRRVITRTQNFVRFIGTFRSVIIDASLSKSVYSSVSVGVALGSLVSSRSSAINENWTTADVKSLIHYSFCSATGNRW